jgi:hypothetical protein
MDAGGMSASIAALMHLDPSEKMPYPLKSK